MRQITRCWVFVRDFFLFLLLLAVLLGFLGLAQLSWCD